MNAKHKSNYERAGLFLIISGLLHLPIMFWAGLAGFGTQMAIAGVIWILIGLGLRKHIRGLPYLAFLLMLFGLIYVFATLGSGPVPTWWWLLIGAADLLAALFLFRVIWSKYRK